MENEAAREGIDTERAPLEPALSQAHAADVRTVARGGAVQIVGQITQRAVLFFFAAIAVRLLGAAGYGLYRQVAQVLMVAGQLGLAGFNYAAMRFIARARATQDHGGVRGAARVAVGASTVTSVVVLVVLLGAADEIASAFAGAEGADETARFADLLRIGAAYVPLFALMQVLRYCTQAYKTMGPSVIAGNVVQPALRFVLGAGALVAGFSVAGAVSTLAASMAAGAVVAAVYFRRMLSAEERAARPTSDARGMAGFAFPQAGASLLGIQSLGLGILVLGLLLESDEPVGLFAVALALQAPGGLFLSGIVNIWAPVVSDLYEKGELERLESLFQTITRWVVTFSFPVFAALILEPDLFVRLFAGEQGAGAAPLVAILAVGNLFYAGTGPTGYVISMTGRPAVNFANSVVAVALYGGLGVLVVPAYGALGMAVVDAVVTALVNTARVVQAKILVGVQPFGRSFAKPVAATLAGVVTLLAWRLLPEWGLLGDIGGLALAACVYLIVLRALGLDPEERYVWERIRARLVGRKLRRTTMRRGAASSSDP